MGIGDIIVYAIAAVAFVLLFLIILNSWKNILHAVIEFVLGWAVIGAALLVVGVVAAAGLFAWQYVSDRQTMQQCMTAYERRAKANTAPDDYFGRQLRQAADEEAKKCAEVGAKQEAAVKSQK
jgi:predicted negative regulator of RcsB-dependent stress response